MINAPVPTSSVPGACEGPPGGDAALAVIAGIFAVGGVAGWFVGRWAGDALGHPVIGGVLGAVGGVVAAPMALMTIERATQPPIVGP
jgi:hypothetical protein